LKIFFLFSNYILKLKIVFENNFDSRTARLPRADQKKFQINGNTPTSASSLLCALRFQVRRPPVHRATSLSRYLANFSPSRS
jgi:hypothetical protein